MVDSSTRGGGDGGAFTFGAAGGPAVVAEMRAGRHASSVQRMRFACSIVKVVRQKSSE
jgi:hypothetical protein